MYKFDCCTKVTGGWNLVFLLLLTASLFVGTQGQGDISRCFPKKATYKVGQKANFTCPRPCDVTGDSIDFYVFDSHSVQPVSLFYYLERNYEDQPTSSYGNDCAEGDSNGSVIASFVIGQQEAGTSLTIYCTDSTSLSPCDSLIQPVLIHVEESVEVCNNTTPSSTSPVHTSLPSPVHTLSPSPVHTSSLSPVHISSASRVHTSFASPSPVHTSSPSPVHTISSVCTPLPISDALPYSASATFSPSELGGIVAGSFIAGMFVGGFLMSLTCGICLSIVKKTPKKAPPDLKSSTVFNEHANISKDTPSLSSDSSA